MVRYDLVNQSLNKFYSVTKISEENGSLDVLAGMSDEWTLTRLCVWWSQCNSQGKARC